MMKLSRLKTVISKFDVGTVRYLVRGESPRVAGFILMHAEKKVAASVLAGMGKVDQRNMIHGVARMEKLPAVAAKQIADAVERKINSLPGGLANRSDGAIRINGLKIICEMSRYLDGRLLERIKKELPDVYRHIQNYIPDFTNIETMAGRDVQELLKNIRKKDLVCALKMASSALLKKICNNLSDRAAADLVQAVNALGPVRRRDVEAAQRTVMEKARELEKKGRIVVRQSDALVE